MTIRVLITGISGVGKSSVVDALLALGYNAVDADTPEYSEWIEVAQDDTSPGTPVEANRDWVWREDRMSELLQPERAELLFVSGTSPNMRTFLPRFANVILLSAPAEIIAQRLSTRTSNDYGKRPEEVARVLELKESVEPLLRRIASHEIDTTEPLEVVVETIVQIATTV